MTKWMCSECGYQLDEEMPPEQCPGCAKTCMFRDVTCYIPECGGEGNINPRLVNDVRKGK